MLVSRRLGIYVDRARIVRKLSPGRQRFFWLDGFSVHGNPVAQQAQHGKAREEAGAHSSVGLLLPPRHRNMVRRVSLNQQREQYVSVGDTRH